jgi:hypothetical protein
MALPGVTGQQRPSLNTVSPVGRFVIGDHTTKRTVDADNRPIADPSKHSFQIGLAVRKDDPAFGNWWNAYMQFAAQCYGNNADAMQRLQRGLVGSRAGGLSLKVKDGDQPNRQNVINDNTRGHWIIFMSTTLPIRTVDRNNALIEPTTIKRGYFVDVAMSISPNFEPGDRAGFYLNPQIIRMIAFGDEIVGGVSPDVAFANAPASTMLPPGASLTPMAPGAMGGGFPTGPAPSPSYGQPIQPGYGAPQMQPQQPVYGAPGAGNPSIGMGSPYPMGAGGPGSPGMPNGAPGVAYPSNQQPQMQPTYQPQPGPQYQQPQGYPTQPAGYPGVPGAGGVPMGAPGAVPAGGLPTGYPINPATGQPVQPHPSILNGPQR